MSALAAFCTLLALAAPPQLAKYYGPGAYFRIAEYRGIRAHVTADTAWGIRVDGFTAIRDDAPCTHVYDAEPGIGGKVPYFINLRLYNPVTQRWGRIGRFYVADCQDQKDWDDQDDAHREVPGLGTVYATRAEVNWAAAVGHQFTREGVTAVQIVGRPYRLVGVGP